MSVFVVRTLYVEGWTWGGFTAQVEYRLELDQVVETLDQAKSVAGDFESLTFAQVVTQTITTVTEVGEVLK